MKLDECLAIRLAMQQKNGKKLGLQRIISHLFEVKRDLQNNNKQNNNKQNKQNICKVFDLIFVNCHLTCVHYLQHEKFAKALTAVKNYHLQEKDEWNKTLVVQMLSREIVIVINIYIYIIFWGGEIRLFELGGRQKKKLENRN